MRRLTRLDAPEILSRLGGGWKQTFLLRRGSAHPKTGREYSRRPANKTYNHEEVRARLRMMSHAKCFYCECGLARRHEEVDHYVECEERPDLAFEWSNLYLSCKTCNGAKLKNPNRVIANTRCVDPCGAMEPHDFLEHVDFSVRGRDERGALTVSKYDLERDDLVVQRSHHLNRFRNWFDEVRRRMIDEGRRALSDAEEAELRQWEGESMPFSEMMRGFIRDRVRLSGA